MFSVGEMVRTLDGEQIGRVIGTSIEMAGPESAQVVRFQLHGTTDEPGQFTRLASELTLHDVQFEELPDSNGKGFTLEEI